MAIVTQLMGESMGAQMFMVLDDVQLKLKQVKLDATNAIGPVIVTVFAPDNVTPAYQRTFQPGENVTQNVPGNADYTLAVRTDAHGVDHILLVAPQWKIEGA